MARATDLPTRSPDASPVARLRRFALVVLFSTIAGATAQAAPSHGRHGKAASEPVILAPGYGSLAFDPPVPGSYTLPKLGAAADGEILGPGGAPGSLHALFGDRIVVLSFIYTSCNDVNGCPLATAVLHRLKTRLGSEADLADRVQLVSLSFDPARDTPPVMARYGEAFLGSGVPWAFATTASSRALAPILEAYGQSVQREFDEEGREIGTLSHVLRVVLIDPKKQIRNIYGVAFLHSDTLIADIRTLLAGSVEGPEGKPHADAAATRDPREGYDDPGFVTQSVTLAARRGVELGLLEHARMQRLGYRPLPEPSDNPLRVEKIALGRRLFFDRRLSHNGTLSCAMCHIPEQGFTNNELATPIGFEGRSVRRNAPTLFDVGYRRRLFYDGRETRLEHQVWSPLLAPNEMANPSVGVVLERIGGMAEYGDAFHAAFPARGLTIETVGMAFASYQRALVSGPAAFDRWRYGGEADAVSEAAKRGFALFVGKANCNACHEVGPRSATFEDDAFHSTGIGHRAAMTRDTTQEVRVAPGRVLSLDPDVLSSRPRVRAPDLGRYEITLDPADRWKYKTPSLRNIALTAPYMHDGSLRTLRDVVSFYRRGGFLSPGLDPLIQPLALSERDQLDLVAFLEALTGDSVSRLVADAFAAPVGERRVEPRP